MAQHDPWLVALSVLVAMGLASAHAAPDKRPGGRHARDVSANGRWGPGRDGVGRHLGPCATSACWPLWRVRPGVLTLDDRAVWCCRDWQPSWVALRCWHGAVNRANVLWNAACSSARALVPYTTSAWPPPTGPDHALRRVGFFTSLVWWLCCSPVLALWVALGPGAHVLRWAGRWLNLAAGAVMGLAICSHAVLRRDGWHAFHRRPGEWNWRLPVGYVPTLSICCWPCHRGHLSLLSTSACAIGECSGKRANEFRLRPLAVYTAVDGMVMINAQGRAVVQRRRQAPAGLWAPRDVVQNVDILMPETDRSRHDTYLHHP